jgi:hypothetical protein
VAGETAAGEIVTGEIVEGIAVGETPAEETAAGEVLVVRDLCLGLSRREKARSDRFGVSSFIVRCVREA